MLVTIFTPTFNRAYILRNLFESLYNQTCKDFEWLIVDDGSTDETEDLVSRFQEVQVPSESVFKIRYIKQENGGKHRAINKGLQEANGELFFIVDSDDRLTPFAIEWIQQEYKEIQNDSRFAGISGIRIHPDGTKIGGGEDFGTIDCNALEIRKKYHVRGDLAEIFKTDVFRHFLFPEFEGERFCPEALVWNRIAQTYNLRFIHKGVYICDYLPDGLTAKIVQVRHGSPLASMTFYSELYIIEKTVKLKLRAAINFWRFFKIAHLRKVAGMRMFNALSLVAMPLGIGANLFDRIMRRV